MEKSKDERTESSSFKDFDSDFIGLATCFEYNAFLKCSFASLGMNYNILHSGPISWDQTTNHRPCYEKNFA